MVYYVLHASVQAVLYVEECLPEDEPLGSKHLEDIINWNINLENVHFVSLYCIIFWLIYTFLILAPT